MSDTQNVHKSAMDMLLETSRTFFIPISRLTPGLQEAVASAYLCMRAIDEIEDHPQLPPETKVNLLRSISLILQKPFDDEELASIFEPYKSILPEVTLRLGEWAKDCPADIAPSIWKATATMSEGMAAWVVKEWQIHNEEDLDDYTFYVAGLVGVMLSEIWLWHDRIETDRNLAIAFGRGLQAVNIIRNRAEDLSRGVNFFPEGWGFNEMFSYAKRNLSMADEYTEALHKTGPIYHFCKIPLVLAHGTLSALETGEEKLSRAAVVELVSQVVAE